VNIEGWQYAGSRMGIMPIVDVVNNVSTETEIKYEARVFLVNIHTGLKTGGGYALCSNKEQGKKFFAEYAIASMAQTRASGKAYRLLLSWVMKAAGYEGTPLEEMDSIQNAEVLEEKKAAKSTISQVQKDKINSLLSHGLINDTERKTATDALNGLTVIQADKWIAGLKKKIEDRESAIAHQVSSTDIINSDTY
jgi:hypothetical protein